MKNPLENLSNHYQSSIQAINSLKNNLSKIIDNFSDLSIGQQAELIHELENAKLNIHYFNEYFGNKTGNKKIITTESFRFLCMQDQDRLIVTVIK